MKTQVHSLFLLVLLASTALAQNNAQSRPPVIDVHMHAYAKDPRWDHKVANPITGQGMTATDEQSHMRATFAEMKKYNIVKALVSTDYEATLRWKTAAPDNVIAILRLR